MISFDVEAMYPSIPVDVTIDVIMHRWDELNDNTPLDKDTFEAMLRFCLTSGYCQFENSIYEQVYGLAIGSSLSRIVVELVLDHIFDLMDKVLLIVVLKELNTLTIVCSFLSETFLRIFFFF